MKTSRMHGWKFRFTNLSLLLSFLLQLVPASAIAESGESIGRSPMNPPANSPANPNDAKQDAAVFEQNVLQQKLDDEFSREGVTDQPNDSDFEIEGAGNPKNHMNGCNPGEFFNFVCGVRSSAKSEDSLARAMLKKGASETGLITIVDILKKGFENGSLYNDPEIKKNCEKHFPKDGSRPGVAPTALAMCVASSNTFRKFADKEIQKSKNFNVANAVFEEAKTLARAELKKRLAAVYQYSYTQNLAAFLASDFAQQGLKAGTFKMEQIQEKYDLFVRAALGRVFRALDAVEFNEDTLSVCDFKQVDVLLVRRKNKGPLLTVCPGMLEGLSSANGGKNANAEAQASLMSLITRALAQSAFDSCAFDRMEIGYKPKINLGDLLQPQRECLAKRSPGKVFTFGQGEAVPNAFSNDVKYAAWLEGLKSGDSRALAVDGAAPHCSLPPTQGDLGAFRGGRREQTNGLSAQELSNRVLARWFKLKRFDRKKKIGSEQNAAVRAAFAPYCAQKSSDGGAAIDAKTFLNEYVARDAGLRDAWGCAEPKDKFIYKKGKRVSVPAKKISSTACSLEASMVAGFQRYLPGFTRHLDWNVTDEENKIAAEATSAIQESAKSAKVTDAPPEDLAAIKPLAAFQGSLDEGNGAKPAPALASKPEGAVAVVPAAKLGEGRVGDGAKPAVTVPTIEKLVPSPRSSRARNGKPYLPWKYEEKDVVAALKGAGPGGKDVKLIDVNGDGYPDAIDKDGDGKADGPFSDADKNYDGKVDDKEREEYLRANPMDLNKDGAVSADEKDADLNGDGVVDLNEKDQYAKEHPELRDYPSKDGYFDKKEQTFDLNRDGIIDEDEKKADKNGDGVVDLEEKKAWVEERLKNGRDPLDRNGDGMRSLDEQSFDINQDGIADQLERKADVNGDGRVDGAEAAKFLKKRPEYGRDWNGNGKLDDFEKKADANGDGVISLDEKIKFKKENPDAGLDIDGDGKVSEDERAHDVNKDGVIDADELKADKQDREAAKGKPGAGNDGASKEDVADAAPGAASTLRRCFSSDLTGIDGPEPTSDGVRQYCIDVKRRDDARKATLKKAQAKCAEATQLSFTKKQHLEAFSALGGRALNIHLWKQPLLFEEDGFSFSYVCDSACTRVKKTKPEDEDDLSCFYGEAALLEVVGGDLKDPPLDPNPALKDGLYLQMTKRWAAEQIGLGESSPGVYPVGKGCLQLEPSSDFVDVSCKEKNAVDQISYSPVLEYKSRLPGSEIVRFKCEFNCSCGEIKGCVLPPVKPVYLNEKPPAFAPADAPQGTEVKLRVTGNVPSVIEDEIIEAANKVEGILRTRGTQRDPMPLEASPAVPPAMPMMTGRTVVVKDNAVHPYLDREKMEKMKAARLSTQAEAQTACEDAVLNLHRLKLNKNQSPSEYFCDKREFDREFRLITASGQLATQSAEYKRGDFAFRYACSYKCHNHQCRYGKNDQKAFLHGQVCAEAVFKPEEKMPEISTPEQYAAASQYDADIARKEIFNFCALSIPKPDLKSKCEKRTGEIEFIDPTVYQTKQADLTGQLTGGKGLLFVCSFDCNCATQKCTVPNDNMRHRIVSDKDSWQEDIRLRTHKPDRLK